MPFIPNAESDRKEMLDAIGKKSIEALFADVPARKRFPKLKLPQSLSEQEALREIGAMAAKNRGADKVSWFLGAGIYNHFIPALVPALASRGEFLTAYTPYQPEVSQGTLQAIFEYQSMAARLFGVSVVNASHYDGATALAEAALMAWKLDEGRNRILLPKDLHPEYKAVLKTYFTSFAVEIEEYSGIPENAPVDARCACLVAGYPSFSGEVYGLKAAAQRTHEAGALFIAHADPLMCANLESPGAQGADIVVAEGQSLGNAMNFGGPGLGMMGATEKLMRRMPGRIVGEAKDHDGRRGFVLTLTAREQHIRREKAVSNICSNQGLVMLQSCIYMAALGAGGMRQVASLCYDKAHYAASLIDGLKGFKVQSRSFFKEFLVSTPIPAQSIVDKLAKRKIMPGLALSRYATARDKELLVCVTEMNSKAEIDRLAAALKEAVL
ncbi:MAG: aminomethyl-transferring glycine dehydrogenase subunit GcvPA [Spirochaetales bacterium]|nr:aminomethyl-transferring glycine dehydrogenase subunit GcvPA [Spirochaetales bacterium]